MRNYKKYDIWKLSHQLTLDIYSLTSTYFPKTEIYNLTNQIRRALVEKPIKNSDDF
jgi:hypothetical protein